MTMKISVVIPTYRRNDTLLPLLAEVVRQSEGLRGEVEIIVVDNAAEGTTRDLVDRFAGHVAYVETPQRGIARARNAGIAVSSGQYVVFVDDDQYPAPGWLGAFIDATKSGDAAYFGEVSPTFVSPPEDHLTLTASALFSRRFDSATNTDITGARARLGTGNSMFSRSLCFGRARAFDLRFDDGGEDVFFLEQLTKRRSLRFRWWPVAKVHELVPPDRVKSGYLMQRRFRNGQLRTRVEATGGRLHAALFWMAVGLVQTLARGSAAVIAFPFDRRRSVVYWIDAQGGMGKLFWFI